MTQHLATESGTLCAFVRTASPGGRICGTGETCLGGSCQSQCRAGQALCDGTCVDVGSDPQHCGACTRVCGAGQACCASVCTDVASDGFNCGGCGRACRGDERCQGGTCVANPSCVPYAGACSGQGECCNGVPCNGGLCRYT